MDRSRKHAVWIAPEVTYATDPDSDGSDYLYVPALEVGLLQDGMTQLPTNYATGRNYPTAPLPGADGWTLEITVPMIGLSAASAASATPSATEDWFGTIIKHILGTVAQVTGRAVSSMASTTAITFAADSYNIQSPLCLYESGLPAAGNRVRSQWSMVTVDPANNSYTIAPALTTQATSAAVAYGHILYRYTDTSPANLALVLQQDSTVYSLLGGRVIAASIQAPAREQVTLKLTISGDSKTVDAGKSSLPLATPSITGITAMNSPLWLGGTKYACKSINVDLGIQAVVDDSTEGPNGRAGYEQLAIAPKVTIEPAFTAALQDLKRAATTGNPLMIQFGRGALASSVINSCMLHLGEAIANEAQPSDDGGRLRLNMALMANDKGLFSGTTLAQFVQFARA